LYKIISHSHLELEIVPKSLYTLINEHLHPHTMNNGTEERPPRQNGTDGKKKKKKNYEKKIVAPPKWISRRKKKKIDKLECIEGRKKNSEE